jgi:putative transposase
LRSGQTISYIYTYEGWLYLAMVKDIFTKEIVGWATDSNMRTELCIKALENAVRRHKPPRGIIQFLSSQAYVYLGIGLSNHNSRSAILRGPGTSSQPETRSCVP